MTISGRVVRRPSLFIFSDNCGTSAQNWRSKCRVPSPWGVGLLQ